MDLKHIPAGAQEIMETISRNGHASFLVGGCVRDLLLERVPHDWDIATDLLPERLLSMFGANRVIPTGLKHGTITIICQGEQLEVTTYRTSGLRRDSQCTAVYGQSLKEDLSNRDFTINAMAMDLAGNIFDPFCGQADLEQRMIQCVGNPDDRFQEDPLRILRALRFASTLGFEIEAQTAFAMHRNRFLLKNVARERITSEFIKLLSGEAPGQLLKAHRSILFQIIPQLEVCDGFEQKHPWHKYDVLEHILQTVDAVSPNSQMDSDMLPLVRMAALLHDVAKPECFTFEDGIGHFYGHGEVSAKKAAEILENCFLFSNRQKSVILPLIKHHGDRFPSTAKVARRWIARYGKQEMLMLTYLQIADIIGSGMPDVMKEKQQEEMNHVVRFQEKLLSINPEQEVISTKNLAVNGLDLIQLGYEPGPYLGKTLRLLTKLVMEETLENSKEALLEKAAEFKR